MSMPAFVRIFILPSSLKSEILYPGGWFHLLLNFSLADRHPAADILQLLWYPCKHVPIANRKIVRILFLLFTTMATDQHRKKSAVPQPLIPISFPQAGMQWAPPRVVGDSKSLIDKPMFINEVMIHNPVKKVNHLCKNKTQQIRRFFNFFHSFYKSY